MQPASAVPAKRTDNPPEAAALDVDPHKPKRDKVRQGAIVVRQLLTRLRLPADESAFFRPDVPGLVTPDAGFDLDFVRFFPPGLRKALLDKLPSGRVLSVIVKRLLCFDTFNRKVAPG
jgi:hypothetical protein